jgi:hypothetical protein
MATITVIAKIGNTFHPKYGALVQGQELQIEEADFGDEIFEKRSSNAVDVASPLAGEVGEGTALADKSSQSKNSKFKKEA